MRHYLASLFVCFWFVACVKDKPKPKPAVNTSSVESKIYVLNEGNFKAGNATLGVYDPVSGAYADDVFSQQNNGEKLGDVGQSISFYGGRFYIVVNNSGKIVVCDSLMKKLGQISGMPSPRFIHFVSRAKAYVSDYKAQGVHVVDLNGRVVTGKIGLSGFTEKMCEAEGKVFVTNTFRDYVYAIDPSGDKIIDSVFVGSGAASIVRDKNGKVWVLASGDQSKKIKARLTCIEPQAMKPTVQLDFNGEDFPSRLCINQTGDTLFYLLQGVRQMAINAGELPVSSFFSVAGANFYALGIDAKGGSLLVSDAIDYVQRSNVYHCDRKGRQLGQFKAGMIATDFYFNPN